VADPQLLGGKLAIRGTRLGVSLILECLASGMSLDDIDQSFGGSFPRQALPDPASIGAKLGDPSRDIVCVTGDGAADFNIMELQVAEREAVKISVVIMVDGEWSMEVPNEMARWGKTFGHEHG
jgi:hypothetical protein